MIEHALAEMMAEHLAASYRQRTPGRWGESGDHYTRGPIAPVGKVERLCARRGARYGFSVSAGALLAEAFDLNGDHAAGVAFLGREVEEAFLAMHLKEASAPSSHHRISPAGSNMARPLQTSIRLPSARKKRSRPGGYRLPLHTQGTTIAPKTQMAHWSLLASPWSLTLGVSITRLKLKSG